MGNNRGHELKQVFVPERLQSILLTKVAIHELWHFLRSLAYSHVSNVVFDLGHVYVVDNVCCSLI